MTEKSLIEFFRLLPNGRLPKRADRSGAGYIPSRAMRYCDAVTSATGNGYWLFPPMTFRLMWDGEQIYWSDDEDADWLPLSGTDSGAIQFPGASDAFDEVVPEFLRGYSPPFITALPEAGSVQIWSGLLVKTRPGWSVNVRAPINLPQIPGLATWEGIVETDIWFGPLFNNFRIVRTDSPVLFRAEVPFLQVLPLPQMAYRDDLLAAIKCSDASEISQADWTALGKVLLPAENAVSRQGDYAVSVRKRRLCPVPSAELDALPNKV